MNPRINGAIERTELSVPAWESRPSVASTIEELFLQEWYKGQMIHRRITEGRTGQTGRFISLNNTWSNAFSLAQVVPTLPDAVIEALRSRNIHVLYTHQVAAIQSINQGKNVVVSTSTASGKSIIYQVQSTVMDA